MTTDRRDVMSASQMQQIDILPDDVLIEIFDLYVNMRGHNTEMDWLSLAHVSRR